MLIHIQENGAVLFVPQVSTDELLMAGVLAVLHRGGTISCVPEGTKSLAFRQKRNCVVHPSAEKELADYTECLLPILSEPTEDSK